MTQQQSLWLNLLRVPKASISATKPPFFFYVKYLTTHLFFMYKKSGNNLTGNSDPVSKAWGDMETKANDIELQPSKKAKSFSW